ncbi:tetratricopeptide repeat protein [Chryseobacterium oryctis]|uniref:Tetratricopeptide repeat protein n=1 Tax=Chryseobacterium oryctis TaxID=2952618 RepID=A0ABT3HJ54_9FLAO|nr:tetratricopeptide repeat protein [Chryseobacterium oryctis]MCW3159809.1 tetratricopeptide repeat protein [Chryseobacterium oryctis]
MRIIFKALVFAFLIYGMTVTAQEIPFDTILKKARSEIYNNPDNSIAIANNLLKKNKNVDQTIQIYMLLSTANIAKRNFDESLQYILKAKELAQKSNNPKTQVRVLTTVAIQYQQMELFSKSFETLEEADIYLAKLPDSIPEKHIETARGYAIRGMIYKSQSNSEIALKKFLKSIESFEKAGSKKDTYANISVVYYNIGYCYLYLNQTDKAHEAFVQSIDYAKKNNAKSLEAFALKGMSELYKQNRENQAALNLLIKAENLCRETKDLILNEGIYKEMADNYLAMGKQDLYQKYNRKFFEMRFKRGQNELKSINHDINNHNSETLKKSEKIKTHYYWLKFFVICLGSIIIIFLLYFILKTKKQNNKYQKEIQQMLRS